MIFLKQYFLLSAIVFGLISCSGITKNKSNSPYNNPAFAKYWNQGKAELTSYSLHQVRYGEMRQGVAVIIFVTEDFSKSKEVKLDDSPSAGKDAVHVLKMNMMKKFTTGIYPYSMMMSVFTPVVGRSHPLKITVSSQEWCGQAFTQLNRKDNSYQVKLYSYFEKEGDQENKFPVGTLLEDDIWTMIRLHPDQLPTGQIRIIPGLLTQRLTHEPIEIDEATASLSDAWQFPAGLADTTNLKVYTIHYPKQKRTLKIYFKRSFPHLIPAWEESYPDGKEKKMLTTTAIMKKTIMLDYWNHNSNNDLLWRDSLMLPR